MECDARFLDADGGVEDGVGCTDTGRADLEGPAAESGCRLAENGSMMGSVDGSEP